MGFWSECSCPQVLLYLRSTVCSRGPRTFLLKIVANLLHRSCILPQFLGHGGNAYPNSLTSCGNQHMPMYMKNDREAIQCAIKISTGIDLNDARIIRIPDTLHVTDIMVSENMLPEILQRNDMQVLGEPEEWPFDENGNLW